VVRGKSVQAFTTVFDKAERPQPGSDPAPRQDFLWLLQPTEKIPVAKTGEMTPVSPLVSAPAMIDLGSPLPTQSNGLSGSTTQRSLFRETEKMPLPPQGRLLAVNAN